MAKWYKKIDPTNLFKGTGKEGENRCPNCRKVIDVEELNANYLVCSCNYHFKIGSYEYFNFLFDNGEFSLLFHNIKSKDNIGFKDKLTYSERIEAAREKTGLPEALTIATGKFDNIEVVLAVMEFPFIGGSLGVAVAEKFMKAVEYCIEKKLPFIIISRSGGIRIMESIYSLVQMIKTNIGVTMLSDHKIPFISVLTDPTLGGVTASYALQGDFVIAEPNALIGYSSPKVISELAGKDHLPKGFQRSEFQLEHGFIDLIVHRKDLKTTLVNILKLVLEPERKTI